MIFCGWLAVVVALASVAAAFDPSQPINGQAQLNANALCPSKTTGTLDLSATLTFGFVLRWTHDCTLSQTRFLLTANTSGWVGLAFNDKPAGASKMAGAEFYFFTTAGQAINAYLPGTAVNERPLAVTTPAFVGTPLVSYSGGQLEAAFTRDWDTADAQHVSLAVATGLLVLGARGATDDTTQQHLRAARFVAPNRVALFFVAPTSAPGTASTMAVVSPPPSTTVTCAAKPGGEGCDCLMAGTQVGCSAQGLVCDKSVNKCLKATPRPTPMPCLVADELAAKERACEYSLWWQDKQRVEDAAELGVKSSIVDERCDRVAGVFKCVRDAYEAAACRVPSTFLCSEKQRALLEQIDCHLCGEAAPSMPNTAIAANANSDAHPVVCVGLVAVVALLR